MLVEYFHEEIKKHILSLKYMVTYYSYINCSFKWTVIKKIIICNQVVTISACIDLFRIFLQTSKNIFPRLNSLSLDERVKVIPYVKKSIFKSVNRFMTLQSLKNNYNSKYFSLAPFQYTYVTFPVSVCSVHQFSIIVQQLGHHQ